MLNYGKCLVILKQVYVIFVCSMLFLYGLYYNINSLLSSESNIHNHRDDIDSTVNQLYSNDNLTWDGLIKDCGSYVIIENSARANEIFNRKYAKQIVEWKGYFLNAFVQDFNPFEFNPEHLVNINVRMIPSESIHNPDLFLSMNNLKYKKYGSVIRSLVTGTPIKFKAEFESLGNEWKPHHLHLLHIEKTDEFIDPNDKIVLFKGIAFNITGHLKNEKEMETLIVSKKENNLKESGGNNKSQDN